MKYTIPEIRKYYAEQPANSCIKLLAGLEHKQIVLIRHAQPNVEKPVRVNFNEAENYLNAYRASGIIPFDDHPVCTDSLPPVNIYCSSLERARQTARHMFPSPKFSIVEDARLRELDRENIRIPFTISHKLHTTLSRIAWLTGITGAEENFMSAMKRVKDCAKHLDQLSEKEHLIIVVAHGFLNFFLARQLKKLGWHKVLDQGNDHLSVKILAQTDMTRP